MRITSNQTTILFIEGTSNENNGNLRQGFHKLFSKKLAGKMPKIIMGEGKSEAIKKFKKNKLNSQKHLLIDLDAKESGKDKDLKNNDLLNEKILVFYMIQEMEAWFFSQPQILDDFYKVDISSKVVNRKPKEINEPDKLLTAFTKKTQKGIYHKVNHATKLLELLDAEQLEKDFPEFKNLINTLSK